MARDQRHLRTRIMVRGLFPSRHGGCSDVSARQSATSDTESGQLHFETGTDFVVESRETGSIISTILIMERHPMRRHSVGRNATFGTFQGGFPWWTSVPGRADLQRSYPCRSSPGRGNRSTLSEAVEKPVLSLCRHAWTDWV
jgi:hypothetical protein